MDIRKLQRVIVDGLEDVKAQNIVVFNTEHLSPLFERVIVASGTSNRQTRSLAASVRDAVKSAGEPPPRTEGEDNGEWIIVDCGAAVVHVMQPAIREYYHLEDLWGDKPVRMKIGAAPPPRLVKAEGAPAEERRSSPRHATAGAASVAKAPARRSAPAAPARAKSATPARDRSTAPTRVAGSSPSRPSARKAAPARHVVRTVGVKSAAKNAASSARPTTRRPAAKKASAKR
jgi:ribosome-associated protein